MNTYCKPSWMWAEACALLDEAERRHRQFFELLSAPAARPVWEPPADIFADGSELRVVVALPGARAHEVAVQVGPSGLQVETVVEPPAFRAHTQVIRMEIPYGRMSRRIDLPAGRYTVIEHRLDHGCLYIRLTREAT
jgi:HSP20 family molecular chaperone IbpA